MFDNDYDGFEFFNGDIQQQYFNYYAYTQVSGDDPFGLFEDETDDLCEQQHECIFKDDCRRAPRQSQHDSDTQHRRHQHDGSSRTLSSVVWHISVVFYALLMIAALVSIF